MSSDGSVDLSRQSNQFLFVLWFANLCTVGLLMGAGYILASGDAQIDPLTIPEDTFASPSVYIFYVLAAILYFMALKLPGRIATKVATEELQKPGPLNPATKIRLMGPYILRIALMETSAIAGFVLAVTAGSYVLGLPLMTLSVVAILLSRPTDDLMRQIGFANR